MRLFAVHIVVVAAVVGALRVLGDTAVAHFADQRMPMETLDRRDFSLWRPADCPLCHAGPPLEDAHGAWYCVP